MRLTVSSILKEVDYDFDFFFLSVICKFVLFSLGRICMHMYTPTSRRHIYRRIHVYRDLTCPRTRTVSSGYEMRDKRRAAMISSDCYKSIAKRWNEQMTISASSATSPTIVARACYVRDSFPNGC